MEEGARLGRDGLVDRCGAEHRADRLVSSAEALGDGDDVRRDAFLLAGEKRPRAPASAHHLVKDQQHAMAIADLADRGEIAGLRRHGPGGRTDHRLCEERDDRLRPDTLQFLLECGCGAPSIRFGSLAVMGVVVGEARLDQ